MIKNIAVLLLVSSSSAIKSPDAKPKLTEPSTPFSEGQVVKREWNRKGDYNLAQSPEEKKKLTEPSNEFSEG